MNNPKFQKYQKQKFLEAEDVEIEIEVEEPDNADIIDEAEAIEEEEDNNAIGPDEDDAVNIDDDMDAKYGPRNQRYNLRGHVNPGIMMGTYYTPLLTEILMTLSNPSP
jgi:hypothetical protein